MLKALRRVLRRLLMPVAPIVGLLCLCFVLGAAVVEFGLPASGFLQQAFRQAEAMIGPKSKEIPPAGLELDVPDQTCDGFTLYTTNAGTTAMLVDMKGNVVHQWAKPFRDAFPTTPHIQGPVQEDQISFSGCHLYPDGRLLVVYEARGDAVYGYGLALLDADSKVLWKIDGNFHHAVDVGEDGKIYALAQRIVKPEAMPKELDWLPAPCLVDDLVVISPEGNELKRIPLLEAIQQSDKYRLLLDQLRNSWMEKADVEPTQHDDSFEQRGVDPDGDIVHADHVEVLKQQDASKFPRLRAGQVLVSLRQLDALAVLDVDTGKLVWAVQGPWKGQNSTRFLDNGNLLVFDNSGLATGWRVIEFDPRTQAFPWTYPQAPNGIHNDERGTVQRLPNGNTFIASVSEGSELQEVTREGKVVWRLRCTPHVVWARRYVADSADALRFLGTEARPRP